MSFVFPLVILFLILLVVVSQLNLFLNFLMWTENVLMNDLNEWFYKTIYCREYFDNVHIFLWINSFNFYIS